jgi:hypothetical protein
MKPHVAIFILFMSSFGLTCSSNPETVVLNEIELPERREFINFWKSFSTKFNAIDTISIRSIALDSIWLWGDHVSSNEFMTRYSAAYSSSDFRGILDTSKTKYSSIGCHPSPPVEDAIKQQYSDACHCDQVLVVQDTVGSVVKGIEFSFLETTKGYRLFAIDYSSSYWEYDFLGPDTTIQAP